MTPDEDNDGVAVWRCAHDNFPTEFTNDSAMAREYGNQEPGRWFTTLRAEQLLAIEKAAREYREWDGNNEGRPNREGIMLDTRRLIDTRAALDATLDALRPAAPGTPE